MLLVPFLLLAACTQAVTGTAVSIYEDPFQVAGLPTTSGPNGLRPGAPPPTVTAEGATDSAADQLVLNALSDIQDFWVEEYPRTFGEPLPLVERFVSWDPRGGAVEFCEQSTRGFINAGYCPLDHSIGWDREVLIPEVVEKFGELAAVSVMAHEYGHAIQDAAEIITDNPRSFVPEQQADCFSGVFLRHVAEGDALRFSANTSDGLNGVLAATVAIRDKDPNDRSNVHGSAFERVTAFQIGFTDGAAACGGIDDAEIESRRGSLPQRFSDFGETGELPVSQESVELAFTSLQAMFALRAPPAVSYAGADEPCPDARNSPPASYCPQANTIGIDLPRLQTLGAPQRPSDLEVRVSGDFSAYSLLASRFTLALQREQGMGLSGAQTALRTACLTGAWTAAIGRGEAGELYLSPGDLDEAVSELLVSGVVASDVNGSTVPSGFARVDAFRTGVLLGTDTCMARYS
jgi:predicted metalloprotease